MNLKGVGQRIARTLSKFRSAQTLACNANNAATQALEAARELAKQGNYEAALEKHVWFHDNALKIQPSYYGVRLSFALGDWVDLGNVYPKALQKLRSIRDQKTNLLLAGNTDRPLFHDVRSINDFLKDSSATVDLFKRIESANSDFASNIYDLADKALLEAREYALARKYLGDPEKRFATAQRYFEEGIEFAKTSIAPDPARRATEQIFSEDVCLLIRILHHTGDAEVAARIQQAALEMFDDDKIRNALKD
jgi:hypothetical protein